jgi:Protein of unknown function (DUF2735)
MNSSFNHGSAKVYQFPAGGRAALGGRRQAETESAADQVPPLVNEAAIQESKPLRER